jgi:predicted membrane-bound spermidine synthase
MKAVAIGGTRLNIPAKDQLALDTAPLTPFSFLFILSGFSALLYQILWQRILTLFSGGDVYAATIIVAVFMAGLGFGSMLGGHFADRLSPKQSVKLFALCEIGIALFAIGSVWLYRNLLLWHFSELARSRFTMALILFAGFLAPTVFMGMSLPFLSRSLTKSIAVAPRVISRLYAFNTLGASLGAFITTWFLLRGFGVERIIRLGALLNLVCGVIAIAYFYRRKISPELKREFSVSSEKERQAPVSMYLLIYALSGFLALSLEILWFRLHGVVLKASTFIFGHLLAIYLLGLGLGGLAGIRWSEKKKAVSSLFLAIQSAIGAYSVFVIIVLVYLADISVLPSFWKYLVAYDPVDLESVVRGSLNAEFVGLYFLIPLIVIFPATFLMGLSYPLLQKILQTDFNRIGRRVGWIQTANYLGSVAGAFLTGLVFLTIFGTIKTFQILLLIPCLFLIVLILAFPNKFKIAAVLGLLMVGLLLWKIPPANYVWGKLHGVDEKSVLIAEDNSGLTILRASEPDFSKGIVFSNGIGIGEFPYNDFHIILGMIPVMLHTNPRDVAIIGLGSGATLFAAAGRAETQNLTCFEIISSQKMALEKYRNLDKTTDILLRDPRIRYEFGDARLHLRLNKKKYDVIETDPIRPDGAHSGNVYSEEYFTLLKQRLKPGGLAVNWAPTPRTASTFIRVFPHVLYLWMPGAILVGSNDPIEWDPEKLRIRLTSEFSTAYYGRGQIDIDAYLQKILAASKNSMPDFDRSKITDFNTDLFPKDEFLVSQSEEFP